MFRRALVSMSLLAAGLVAVPAAQQVAHADGLNGGGEFHPLTPARIYDSRNFDGGPINEAAPGPKQIAFGHATFPTQVLGKGGIPNDPSQVLAIVANITVTGPSSAGVLAAYGNKPTNLTSLLNFQANDVVSNNAIISPDSAGNITIDLYGGAGTAYVVIDVFGWLSTSNVGAGASQGSRLIPTNPGRILDTRDGYNVRQGPISGGTSIDVPIRGVVPKNSATALVPGDGSVVGAVLNVVGITDRPGGVSTYLAATPAEVPAGQSPTTSNVNLPASFIKANLVIVPVGADGKVHIFNKFGQADVAIDLVGYLQSGADPASTKGRVVPLAAPFRTFDTREAAFSATPLGPGQAESWSFAAFQASVKLDGNYVGAQSAVIGNLTNASIARQYASVPVLSYLTAWPTGLPRPETSNVDTNEIPIAVPNMSIMNYSTDGQYTLQMYNYAGYAHYLFDASAVVLQ